MTEETARDWHQSPATIAEELTVRLGAPFSELCLWAAERKLEFPLELSYHILGLDESTPGVANLVQELTHPESKTITSKWDDHPIVHELRVFSEIFAANAAISKRYPILGHKGGVKKTKRQFGNFATRTFLLTLITNPLADDADEPLFSERRRLRIWLLVQAASRFLDYRCAAEASISEASRFLVIDSGDPQWALIDDLLERTRRQLGTDSTSYERFTTALENAAGILKHGSYPQRTSQQFLNAILSITRGSCRPIEPLTLTPTTYLPLHLRPIHSPLDEAPFETEDACFNVVPSASAEDEGEAFAYVTEIDPTDSVAQQTLNSGSVFIQTAELSHYLPWSWDRLLPPEIRAVESWVHHKLISPEALEKIGSALVWMAMRLSRSLTLLERLTIESEMTAEWSLSPDLKVLKRTSPRRQSAWQPDESTRRQVAAFRNTLTIAVPEFITDALKTVIVNAESSPVNLGDVWRSVSSEKLETWFNEQARAHFPRVSSAKLAHCRSQQLFDLTGDFNFTRLLTSHPNSALPGACSYASWDIKTIEKGLELPVQKLPTDSDSTPIMGSLLVPIESVLCQEIKRANEKLEQAYNKGLIHYHNALTQYVVMALYAATGARPLRDPFESARHFALKHHFVYINDKNDEGLHNGRLVPLPGNAAKLLSYYQRYLNQLSQRIRPHRSELAQKTLQLAKGQPAHLPLFFLLDANLRWHSMAEAGQLDCALFEWALPGNLFRHRYSQRLLQEGVDPEVIEGWMGHAERGSATYSDYSVRCWTDDANTFQDSLDRVYDALPLTTPANHQELPALLYVAPAETTYSEPEVFGQRARSRQRRTRLKAALQAARDDISLFLNGRSIGELEDDDLLRLSHRMLTRENRLPHPQAPLRFRVLTRLIKSSDDGSAPGAEAGDENGKEGEKKPAPGYAKRQILKKRLVNVTDERSLVAPEIIAALELYPRLARWAETVRKSALKASLSRSRARCVGAALMAVEKRLGYKRLLLDVMAGQHFRLVQNDRQYFFEYSEGLNPNDFSRAVQRHEISYKVASLLAHGQALKKHGDTPSPSSIHEFKDLLELYGQQHPEMPAPSMANLLAWLCRLINQANLVQLPGLVAAALSERSPPTSASLRDFTRIVHGRVIDLPSNTAGADDLPSAALSRPRAAQTDKLSLQDNAKVFTQAMTDVLHDYEPSKARECAQKLNSLCKHHQGDVSSAIVLIGYWIYDRTRLGKGPVGRKLDPYAKNSLTTYWSSIASAFRGFAYNVDLVSLDSDEVTDLCAQMLEHKHQTTRHTDYFGKRLKDFFQWAARFGVVAPEWDELDIDSGYRTVSSGLITEGEYQACQDIIQADTSLTTDQQLIFGFVLLLTYRFGLRANEAIALLHRDWCEDDRFCWVLVQNNQYRRLKSKASRRAIPLLFELSEREQGIVNRIKARYSSLSGTQTNRPLLCEASANGTPILTSLAPRISEVLIQILRSVTGNPELVLHHCRHSFYNRLAPALFDLNNPLAGRLSAALEHTELRRAILGQTHNVSRRSAMALARLMGHRFPSTGLKNYCHLVTDWSDALTPVVHQRARKLAGAIQVSDLPRAPTASPPEIQSSLAYPPLSLGQLFKALRLVAMGMTYERAGFLLQIHPQYLGALEKTLERANERMRFSSPTDKKVKLKGRELPHALLKSLSDGAWQRLIHHAEQLPDPITETTDEALWPGLAKLPYQTSLNRQLLMDQPCQCRLVALVVDLFKIPREQYVVIANNNSIATTTERMSRVGFMVVPEAYVRANLDGFSFFDPNRNSHYQAKDYGGLVLHRSAGGVIRNSFELAVAFLATGVLVQCGETDNALSPESAMENKSPAANSSSLTNSIAFKY